MNESRRHGDEKQILEWVEMVEKTQYSGSDFYVHAFFNDIGDRSVGNRIVSYGKNYDRRKLLYCIVDI